MGWSDVGSWGAIPEIVEPGESGTVCINAESHVTIESSDNIIYMDGRMIATGGGKGADTWYRRRTLCWSATGGVHRM